MKNSFPDLLIIRLKWFFIYGILILTCNMPATAKKYAVESIRPELIENAIAVVREYHTEIEVMGNNHTQYRKKLAITIMEPRGLGLVDVRIEYDSFRTVSSISGRIYDSEGNQIREIQKNEFKDRSLLTGFSVFNDHRYIETDLYWSQYPFTVEFEYIIDMSFVFLNEVWHPVGYTNVSVEKSSLQIIVPSDLTFRHNVINNENAEPKVQQTQNNKTSYLWDMNQMPAIILEPYMPRWHIIYPHIIISPNDFIYGGIQGNMETWENFGEWISELNKNRQRLPRRLISQIQSLTAHAKDTHDKIRIIYEYVQNNTRYVSIILGMGGFQPEPAADVHRNGYGDCKALSIFTMALLDAVGIKSYYALIQTGDEHVRIDPNFPHNYFNHVIVCVPLENDTIWLETTSKNLPVGFIGIGNVGRYVLLVTEDGGKLVTTTRFKQEENVIDQVITAYLNAEGSISGSLLKNYTGLAFEERSGFEFISEDSQKEFFITKTPVNRLLITEISYNVKKDEVPEITKKVSFNIQDYLRKAGSRYIFQPVIMQEVFPSAGMVGSRTHDFEIGSSFVYHDLYIWHLPEYFQINQLPSNIELNEPYGYYKINFDYQIEKNILNISRIAYFRHGLFESKLYDEFAAFLRGIQRGDRSSIMLTGRN